MDDRSLKVLKVLIRRRDTNLTTSKPCIKVTESDVTLPSFPPGNTFPAAFDGKTTDDDKDGNDIDASPFIIGDIVAVQAWFGSYLFIEQG